MNYASIKMYDIANGPGCRVSLFVSGCRNNCPGCFNKDAQDFNFGEKYTKETESYILSALGDEHISGLSILGGEPFEPENQKDILSLCANAKKMYPNKDIWIWTGLEWEDINDLLIFDYIDVLIDGPFLNDMKDLSLAYRGSYNQRVIDIKKSIEAGCAVRLEGDWK